MKPVTGHADRQLAPSDPVPFETLRFDPSVGFVRLERHLARWRRSSAWLGFSDDVAPVLDALQRASAAMTVPHRVRVSLGAGGIEVTATPLPMRTFNDTPEAALAAAAAVVASGGALPRAAIARQRVDETDPARSHKTTARELYYAGRRLAEARGLEDVIFLDSRGLLSEGSIATVFIVDESGGDVQVATPPLSSGALPGVLREELLETGLVAERDITEDELRGSSAVLVGSSVRGLRRVLLEEEPVDVS